MPFVQAKCPNCGGFLAVNSTHDAAVCQFCNAPFIVEKAIINYNVAVNGNVSVETANITVSSGPTVSSLLTRANDYFAAKDFSKALEYYDRVLDLDPTNDEAKTQIATIKKPHGNNLIITRADTYLLSLRKATISLDGHEIGNLKNGGSAEYCIALGKHQLSIKISGAKSDVSFSIAAGFQKAHVSITPISTSAYKSTTLSVEVNVE